MEKVKNLRTLYENTQVPSSFEVNYAVTLCNYQVMEIIVNVLNDVTPNFDDFIANYLTMLRYTNVMTDLDIDTLFKELAESVAAMCDLVNKETYDIESLCFYLGVDTESKERHTLHTRFIIILAIATLLGEKFEF